MHRVMHSIQHPAAPPPDRGKTAIIRTKAATTTPQTGGWSGAGGADMPAGGVGSSVQLRSSNAGWFEVGGRHESGNVT